MAIAVDSTAMFALGIKVVTTAAVAMDFIVGFAVARRGYYRGVAIVFAMVLAVVFVPKFAMEDSVGCHGISWHGISCSGICHNTAGNHQHEKRCTRLEGCHPLVLAMDS